MAPENPQQFYLGVDGGGTGTRAALVDRQGNVLGIGHAGPSNYQATGRDAAKENIALAITGAWRESGFPPQGSDGVFLGMAGILSERDRETIGEIADELRLADSARIGVDHDLRTALAGGLGGGPGIVLIAGTGSSCYGRRDDGKSWRAGGWGHLLDDLGGGYWLGLQGLIAITRAADGRGGTTTLTPSLTGILQLESLDDLLRLVHHQLSRADIAALAEPVLAAADEGDQVAWEIVRSGVEELAKMVQAVAQSLDWIDNNVETVMSGGLIDNPVYAAEVAAVIGKRAPNVQLKRPLLPPVLGAALLALELGGVETIAAAREVMEGYRA
jgi:N-acetylglucosamine kinase-like BadF-type ATPase